MDVLVERCAGLDVHKDTVQACVRVPGPEGRETHQHEFGTTTRELLGLRDWLVSHGVTLVGMESTGVYWKPIYYILEDAFECHLLNARHLRNVPGRKTDVKDAAWICQLVEHGLVRSSFVPPKPFRELRNLTRYRKTQIEERTREAQRLDKILQDAGVKLSSVASDICGASGRAMLTAMVEGTRDPAALAELAKGRLRAKLPALQEALQGRFGHHHSLIVSAILAHLEFLDEIIDRLSDQIEEAINPFALAVEMLRTIPGVDRRTAEVLAAEIGVDLPNTRDSRADADTGEPPSPSPTRFWSLPTTSWTAELPTKNSVATTSSAVTTPPAKPPGSSASSTHSDTKSPSTPWRPHDAKVRLFSPQDRYNPPSSTCVQLATRT